MRGPVPGLVSPYPIGSLLPAVYQEDDFAQRFTAGLDDVLAPAIAVLDSLDAYLDPLLTPSDFLPWLAGWLGTDLDENTDDRNRRRAVRDAAPLFAARGTTDALRAELAIAAGRGVTMTESGGVYASDTAGGCAVAPRSPEVCVRLPGHAAYRRAAVRSLLASIMPAHVACRIEVAE
ncbi:phage tail protein [Streptomyces sp. NPDC090021]|uniref:phage tail protein n=1 Tax=Streptomyces sp. NPDC090021 TaxID=3365919 RepID=UPI003809D500